MDPAMLLNPKAFAKSKAKKKAPNYGPKQSRKNTKMEGEDDIQVVVPTYDPKTLLNPKASSSVKPVKSAEQETANAESDAQNGSSATTSLYERHHGVTNRQAPMSLKRSAPGDFENDDVENKKQKSTFGNIGRGTVLSEHMRKEREKLNVNAAPPVDLTVDTEDNDLEILGSNVLTREVCLGMITVNINAHTVPHVSLGVAARLGKEFWPQTKVHFHRPDPAQRQIIDVRDSTQNAFGKLDNSTATALSWLMDGSQFTKFRAKPFLKMRPRQPGEASGQPISRVLKMTITIYAVRNKAEKIGAWLKSKGLLLENPPVIDSGIDLFNPHNKTINGLPDYRPEAMRTGVVVKRPVADPSYVTRTVEEMRREASTMFDGLVKNEDLPEMDVDDTKIKTKLKPHQKQALHFLVEHEKHDFTSTDTPGYSLWKPDHENKGGNSWYNVITLEKSASRPDPTRGGILADMMGLGKSLSILSLIAQTNDAAKDFAKNAIIPQHIRNVSGCNVRATLIVCPKSVISSWQEQIREHAIKIGRETAKEGKEFRLSYMTYHGTNRTRSVEELAQYHIILTSYGTVATDFNARAAGKRTLMCANWFRVVLDEAHTIRNASTTASKACCELTADRRWAVTGTPIQNRLEDLGALIKFLRVKPFDDPTKWAQYITAPFKMANQDVLQHLRLLIDSITLRRTRDIIQLPPRTERIVRLAHNEEESALYSAFASQSNLRLQSLVRETKGLRGKSMMHVLRSIGRLRMLCAHGREMLSEEDMEEIQGMNKDNAIDLGDEPDAAGATSFVSERQAYDMLQLQIDGAVADCVVCDKAFIKTDTNNNGEDDTPEETEDESGEEAVAQRPAKSSAKDLLGYLTPCWHLLHPACKQKFEAINEISKDNYHECPQCTEYVRNEYFPLTKSGLDNFVNEKSKRSRIVKKANVDPQNFVPHTKVKALIEALQESAEETKALPAGEPPIRSVVFTEWTTYIDLIEYGLDMVDIPHIRLDGSMSLKQRTAVLKQFREDPNATVLIISIRAGGQGLNLTAANKVYLMEPQFNPGVEQQAVDRVHRLGQQREVEITHYIMTGTVEEGVLKLQDKKNKLALLSFNRKNDRHEDVQKKIEELRDLFK